MSAGQSACEHALLSADDSGIIISHLLELGKLKCAKNTGDKILFVPDSIYFCIVGKHVENFYIKRIDNRYIWCYNVIVLQYEKLNVNF